MSNVDNDDADDNLMVARRFVISLLSQRIAMTSNYVKNKKI